jgi:hypothetical protein
MQTLCKVYKLSFSSGLLKNDKILFFGSGRVALPSVVKLIENKY